MPTHKIYDILASVIIIFNLLTIVVPISASATSISLESPLYNAVTMDNRPDFRFTITSGAPTVSCTLFLQKTTSTTSKSYGIDNNVVSGVSTVITPSSPIPNGVYLWWISCYDGASTTTSQKLKVTISLFRGDKTFTSSLDGSTRYYWLDLPDNFDNSVPTPLVIFLHGYGGSRLSYPQKYPALRATFQSNTWIVASVECRSVNGYQNWYTETTRRDITDVLNIIRSSYDVDSSHIHVVGNSMGGGGSLKYAMFNKDVIASLVDIHGITDYAQFYIDTPTYKNSLIVAYGGTPDQVPEVYADESALGNEQRFSHTPVMILHGAADNVVSVTQSRNLYQSLSALGYTVKYIEVPGVGHDALTLMTGRETEIFNWLKDHPLNAEGPQPVTIIITSNPAGSGFVNVDGSEVTTPKTYSWSTGSQHILSAISPVGSGSGRRNVFVVWSDAGTQSHTYVVSSLPQTVTANYETQYYFTVNSDYGSPVGAGWYDLGSTASFSVTSPAGDGTGAQYVCTGFSGDASGSGTSGSIIMDGPKSVTFSWSGAQAWARTWYVYSGNRYNPWSQQLGSDTKENNVNFDYNWGSGTIAYSRSDRIGFVSTRKVNLASGSWTFTVGGDDGARLYLDGKLIINGWKNQAYTTYSYTTSFSGTADHTLRLEYYEYTGNAHVSFKVKQR
jgi:predicted esterase